MTGPTGASGATGISCAELVELVTAYLDGALDPVTQERFAAHFGECSGCERYLEQFRETIRLVGRLSPATMSPAARDDLLAAFRDWPGDAAGPDEMDPQSSV